MSDTRNEGREGQAVISDCGKYRYALYRNLVPEHEANQLWLEDDQVNEETWGQVNETCLFVMLNPSTADATEDDPTIRRCRAFATLWGFGRIAVANVFAYRATDPRELGRCDDPVGPENDNWICQLANESAWSVAAWGSSYVDPVRMAEVCFMLDHNTPFVCLGTTKEGHPRHPLYVPGDTAPVPYEAKTYEPLYPEARS